MVICGSYKFEFSVRKDMNKIKEQWWSENSSINCTSNTNCQKIETSVEQSRVVST